MRCRTGALYGTPSAPAASASSRDLGLRRSLCHRVWSPREKERRRRWGEPPPPSASSAALAWLPGILQGSLRTRATCCGGSSSGPSPTGWSEGSLCQRREGLRRPAPPADEVEGSLRAGGEASASPAAQAPRGSRGRRKRPGDELALVSLLDLPLSVWRRCSLVGSSCLSRCFLDMCAELLLRADE